MKAEIISVGTELLLGHTINTDASLIARALAELGLDLLHVQTVGDNKARLLSALELAASRSDIIFTSGGLGPTDDDLTKSAVASFLNVPLVEYNDASEDLKQYFGERPMSANQSRQAYLPRGAVMFPNAVGTAPGCAVPMPSGGFIILLPGPPSELISMLNESVRPFLQALSNSHIHTIDVRTFGIGEGAAAEKIIDLMESANPTVAPYAGNGEMLVRVAAKAKDEAAAIQLCMPVVEEVTRRLGDVVYGTNTTSLEATVLSLLLNSNKTISTAESCTGGLLAKRLTDLPGSSAAFQLGVVTYSNEAKVRLLHVPAELIERHGAVSQEVAFAMAQNVRDIAGTDYAIGITGLAGPDGATPSKPVGLVYIALATVAGTWLHILKPKGRYLGRDWVRHRASSIALDMVRRALTGLGIVVEM